MGITIKSMNGLVAIKKLGIDPDKFEWLVQSGIEVKLTSKAFEFIHPETNPPAILVHVDVTLTQLQELNKGELSSVDKKTLRVAIEEAADTLAMYLADNPINATAPKGALALLSAKNVVKGITELGEDKPKPKPPMIPIPGASGSSGGSTKPSYGGFPMFDLTKLKTASKVKLRDATHMYQPVSGTSGGSRYFLMAGGSGIKIAARYGHSGLSVRVEGEDFATLKTKISKAGFDLKGSEYGSIHLSIDDDLTARKALGAILMALCVELETPFPDLAVIKNVK